MSLLHRIITAEMGIQSMANGILLAAVSIEIALISKCSICRKYIQYSKHQTYLMVASFLMFLFLFCYAQHTVPCIPV